MVSSTIIYHNLHDVSGFEQSLTCLARLGEMLGTVSECFWEIWERFRDCVADIMSGRFLGLMIGRLLRRCLGSGWRGKPFCS